MKPFTLNIRGRLVHFERPAVMGIVNVTPDSFYAGSRAATRDDIRRRAEAMVAAGARMLDIGGCSSRPGADEVLLEVEKQRIELGLGAVEGLDGDVLVSVDTYRADVARFAVEHGAHIVNDISAGALDPEMIPAVAALKVPYIAMHMRGTPATMATLTDYGSSVAATVVAELSVRVAEMRRAGIADVIVDPGFGFAKTLRQNYQLLRDLQQLELLGCPVLVGVSRKSMATKLLGITAEEALPATCVLNALALQRGAAILRVHDVPAALQTAHLLQAL